MDTISIAKRIESLLPPRSVLPARLWYLRARARFYRGDAVYCPCCSGQFSRFLDVGNPPRPAACPGCDSRERHRLLCLYLSERTNLFRDRLRVLHVAPEDCLQPMLSRLDNLEYISADLASPRAMVRMNLTDIRFPDDSFDVILCSHVLEHIDDDRKAMRELRRVLRPGGWAILQVPVDGSRDATYEDPSVTDPIDRERLFGQSDHVRVYGRDYPDRLREAGFVVDIVPYVQLQGSEAARDSGLDAREEVYHCHRPQ
jgi:SAM-dependent methyltransferase